MAQAEQSDAAGNVGRSAARTFTVPEPEDVGEVDVPDEIKRSHVFCKRAKGCKGLTGTADFRDTGKAAWKLSVTYKLDGRTRTATVARLTQRITEPGTVGFKLAAIGKTSLMKKLKNAADVTLTLRLTFTDHDGNRTVKTETVEVRRG